MSYGSQLKKARIAAGLTIDAAAKAKGVSKRLWEYWEADQKLPPRERDALTRERLLAWAQTMSATPGSSNDADEGRAKRVPSGSLLGLQRTGKETLK